MNASETRAAAQVMLDSLKPGAEVEGRGKTYPGEWVSCTPSWNWNDCEYRIKPKPRRWWIAETIFAALKQPTTYTVFHSKKAVDEYLRNWQGAEVTITITEVEAVKEEKR